MPDLKTLYAEGAPSAHAARQEKATKLAIVLQSAFINAELAAELDPDTWAIAAQMASVEPPSRYTIHVMLEMLRMPQ